MPTAVLSQGCMPEASPACTSIEAFVLVTTASPACMKGGVRAGHHSRSGGIQHPGCSLRRRRRTGVQAAAKILAFLLFLGNPCATGVQAAGKILAFLLFLESCLSLFIGTPSADKSLSLHR